MELDRATLTTVCRWSGLASCSPRSMLRCFAFATTSNAILLSKHRRKWSHLRACGSKRTHVGSCYRCCICNGTRSRSYLRSRAAMPRYEHRRGEATRLRMQRSAFSRVRSINSRLSRSRRGGRSLAAAAPARSHLRSRRARCT